MGMVGGSRHYDGGGLGPMAGWACPSCGGENQGPLEQGCLLCGAGKPGHKVEAAPPPPPPAPPAPPVAPALNEAQVWIQQHPGATLEEAFTAGYIEGVRQAKRDVLAQQLVRQPQPLIYEPAGIVNRTLIAALTIFRDQILVHDPEEVASGEWLSVHQVNGLMKQLAEEVAHG